ncbi:MAG: hypothetical protein JW860_02430 [Sedimentisphaerales bacterium]|nr:hypothetical protein [Sedimentisphaerales bacterium]
MSTSFGHQLKAWGRFELPATLEVAGSTYRRVKVFKHDFFAATLLFERQETTDSREARNTSLRMIVLKVGRRGDFLGIPMGWLGRALCRREWQVLSYLQHLSQVPHLISRYGRFGFIYEYIDGTSLDEKPPLPDDFFDNLGALIKKIHDSNIAYIDLNKRGNILLRSDNRPGLIDFQIACHIHWPLWPFNRLGQYILRTLQKEDFYHLNKQRRQLARHLMTREQIIKSRRKSGLVQIHRIMTRGLTLQRRRILNYLFQRGSLVTNDVDTTHPESNPARWEKH